MPTPLAVRRRRPAGLVVLLALLGVVMMLSSASGAFSIPLEDMLRVLFRPGEQDALAHRVLVDVRLPRVVLGMTAGAGLAIAGTAMQALFRNPLADPGLIGISSGAAVGAVAAIVLGEGGFFSVAGAAFTGSLLATWCG